MLCQKALLRSHDFDIAGIRNEKAELLQQDCLLFATRLEKASRESFINGVNRAEGSICFHVSLS
jgi:hypothetical protein